MAFDALSAMVVSADQGELTRRAAILRRFDYDVASFREGDAAITHLTEFTRDEVRYSLLVTDIVLGRERGFAVADIFWEMTGRAPVIFVYDGPPDRRTAIPQANTAFLSRPFSTAAFVETIYRLLPEPEDEERRA
jgi:DNA-binding NtrC family response regulator